MCTIDSMAIPIDNTAHSLIAAGVIGQAAVTTYVVHSERKFAMKSRAGGNWRASRYRNSPGRTMSLNSIESEIDLGKELPEPITRRLRRLAKYDKGSAKYNKQLWNAAGMNPDNLARIDGIGEDSLLS
jgi:hypothetical protein